MCVHVGKCIHACVYLYVPKHASVHTYMLNVVYATLYVYACECMYVHTNACVWVYAVLHMYTYTFMCGHIHIQLCICMHMCIVYTGISVQTHTQSFRAHMYELLQSWGLYIKFDAEFRILVVWWVE